MDHLNIDTLNDINRKFHLSGMRMEKPSKLHRKYSIIETPELYSHDIPTRLYNPPLSIADKSRRIGRFELSQL